MMGYPIDELWDELTFLARELSWDLDALLDLEHPDRHRLIGRLVRQREDDRG